MHACTAKRVWLLTLGAHAQRGLQYSVCVSVSVSDTTLQASVVKETLKFRHQRTVNDTLQSFDSWILLTMLGSRDMAKFVSQEAYDRASLPETSAHVINHILLLFVIEHVLFYQSMQFVRFSVGELSHLFKQAFMQRLSWFSLVYETSPGCGGMVHIRKVSCSCGHVFVAKHNKHTLH